MAGFIIYSTGLTVDTDFIVANFINNFDQNSTDNTIGENNCVGTGASLFNLIFNLIFTGFAISAVENVGATVADDARRPAVPT